MSEEGDFHASGIIIVPLKGKNNSVFKARAILDSGAGTNFVSKDILPYLNYEHLSKRSMRVTGINSTENRSYDLVRIFISDKDCPIRDIKCFTLPGTIRYSINKNAYNSFLLDCVDLPNFNDPFIASTDHGQGLGLILGPGVIKDISLRNPTLHNSHLVDHTFFGPAVSGRLPYNDQSNTYFADPNYKHFKDALADDNYFYDEATEEKIQLLQDLEFLRDREILGVKRDEMHQNDAICMQKFKQDVKYDPEKRKYVVALPFKSNKNLLPTNEYVALRRTQLLQRSFIKDKNYGLLYQAQIEKLLVSDFIEEVFPGSPTGDVVHYLPHRGVTKKESLTTSLRIVMDASSRPNGSSLCLNDTLYKGPNLIVSMSDLLLKFRLEKYAACADVEKAFLMLLIRLSDRDALRFFFPSNIFQIGSPMRIFRYKAVMFGASCSPFLLSAVIQVHIEKHVSDRVLQESLKNIFIDNLLVTKKSEVELLTFYHQARSIYNQMGLNLRMWASNSELVVREAKKDMIWDNSNKVKVLGHLWDPKDDTMSYNTEIVTKPKYTKRVVVGTGNQIKNTFGFLLPVEMKYRIFVQKLWYEKYSWDKSFGKNSILVKEWDLITANLIQSLTATFARTLETFENAELHVFSDASFGAYGAVAYIVIPPNKDFPEGLSQVRFAKGRVVSPKKCPKKDTIPKLELMGIVVAANIANNLVKVYDNLKFQKKILWSDNKTALSQCSKPVNDLNFVHNRVQNIRALCPDFEIRYVNTNDNPADLITKPIKAADFLMNRLWWKGPEWLPNKDRWSSINNEFCLHPEGSHIPIAPSEPIANSEIEITTMYGHMASHQNEATRSASEYYWNFGDYKSLIKFFSGIAVLKNLIKLDKPKEQPYKGILDKYPIENKRIDGTILAIKTMQKECFPTELANLQQGDRVQNKKFFQLKLYLDEVGIIRIQGRLNDKHFTKTNKPILFGYRHPLTILYILDQHRMYNCSGVSYSLNKIRRVIHSPKLRRQVREIIHKCIPCRALLGRAFKHPEHPPLDIFRTKCSRPFHMCGVDYIGPFPIYVNQELSSLPPEDIANNIPDPKIIEAKAYILIFSCLVSRAINLVLVTDRSTETFLRAFRQFSARNCEPRLLLSDNEGAFKAANKVLKRIAERSEVANTFQKKGIFWKFLPSRASWMGGVYERLVQIVKIELMKLQRKAKFNHIEWCSHLAEIEQILNDRPLSYVSDDPLEPEVVTPYALIHGCLNETPLVTDLSIDEAIAEMRNYQSNPEKLYKEKIKIKNQFWAKISDEYISALNISSYRKNKSLGKYCRFLPQVGGVVSIKDHDTKLGGRLAVIVRLIPSSDGEIRQAEIKTTVPSPSIDLKKNLKTVYKIKAISQLIPLELQAELQEPLPVTQNLDNAQSDPVSSNSQTNVSQPLNDFSGFLPEHSQNLSQTQGLLPDADQTEENPNENDLVNINKIQKVIKDSLCSLPNCLKPVSTNERVVKWVKCNTKHCKIWCHYDCAGIPYVKEFNDTNIYICPLCMKQLNEPSDNLEQTDMALKNGGNSESATRRSNRRGAKTKFDYFMKNIVKNQ